MPFMVTMLALVPSASIFLRVAAQSHPRTRVDRYDRNRYVLGAIRRNGQKLISMLAAFQN
jgi:hypothetical protein